VKYSPEEFAPESEGMRNLRELPPEALVLVSSVGAASPGKAPLLSPYPPAMSDA
jgi:hypothetical protein